MKHIYYIIFISKLFFYKEVNWYKHLFFSRSYHLLSSSRALQYENGEHFFPTWQ